MGAHIMVRKKGMTRADVVRLLDAASFLSVLCFVKETCYPDFEKKFGKGSLFLSSARLEDIPDSWIDYEGDVVFNNMGYSTSDEIEPVLGFSPPTVDSEAHNSKRSRGGAIHLIRGSPPPEVPEPVKWMAASELLTRLPKTDPGIEMDAPGRWVYETFRAIAEGGFDCCILV